MTPLQREVLRWTVSAVAVLAIHVGGALGLMTFHISQDMPPAPPPVMLDLSDVAAAPSSEQEDKQPDKQQEKSEPEQVVEQMIPEPEPPEPVTFPEPDKLAELLPPPPVPPEVVIEVPEKPKPKPKPKVKPTPVKPKVEQTTAPPPAPVQAPQVTSAVSGSGRVSPDQKARWMAMIQAKIKRNLRYPSRASRDDAQGHPSVDFVMDRAGHVLSKQITRSSGNAILDQEALDVLERSQPLPAPPAEMEGQSFPFRLPVEFNMPR